MVATAYCLKSRTTTGPRPAEVPGGCIALSRDLVKKLKAQFGDIIEVAGVGRFTFADLMPPKWRMRVDIYLPTRKECLVFGVQRREVRIVR